MAMTFKLGKKDEQDFPKMEECSLQREEREKGMNFTDNWDKLLGSSMTEAAGYWPHLLPGSETGNVSWDKIDSTL